MDRRTMIKAKMANLNSSFQPFLSECERRGFPIRQLRFREFFPGDITTPISADVLIDWRNGRGFVDSAIILQGILEKTVAKDELKDFFGFNISDTQERFNFYERPEPYIQLLAG